MVIKCTLSGSTERIKYSVTRCSKLPPLPGYISKRGPYVKNGKRSTHKIIILYEFDRARLKEAWKTVSREMDTWHTIAGLDISAHILETT
jgi:hypothetical protein